MKTTIKIIFRESMSNPGKGTPVWQIIRHRTTRKVATSFVLSADEWNDDRQQAVGTRKTSPDRMKELEKINEELKKDMMLFRESADMLESRGDYSSLEVADCFRKQKQGQLFCEYIEQVVKAVIEENRFGTAETYRYSGVSFKKYLGGKDISIDKITCELINDYERWLKVEKKSKNTISCYMRSLRAIYNRAIREKVFIVDKNRSNPFSEVFTGNAKTEKRAAGVKEISKLMELELEVEEGKKRGILSTSISLDIFLFCIFTQGMAFMDAAYLKKEDIKDGIIRYKRRKTGQLITIQMESHIANIIKRYANPNSGYVFPIFERCENSDERTKWKKAITALAVHNRNLDKLAKLAGIEQHLTSYVARHSWASIASQAGIPIATISKGMGHESEKTTRIYISQLDFSDVSRANRKVISNLSKNRMPILAGRSQGLQKNSLLPKASLI